MTVKIGLAMGRCERCGRVYTAPRPAQPVTCDCYKECPICGAEMTPFNPGVIDPETYRGQETPLASTKTDVQDADWRLDTLYYCATCDYYSSQPPVEVTLE